MQDAQLIYRPSLHLSIPSRTHAVDESPVHVAPEDPLVYDQSRTSRSLRLVFLCTLPADAVAESVVELPVLASLESNERGVLEILLLHWDQKPEPPPVASQWLKAGVILGQAHVDARAIAFHYAVNEPHPSRIPGPSQFKE